MTVASTLEKGYRAMAQTSCRRVLSERIKDKRRIAIGMADYGIGIHSAIRRSHSPASEADAIRLALTPGISGATPRIGGNETNAGAGLFFIRSIAKATGNFFVIHSGETLYKLLRKQTLRSALHGNPFDEDHRLVTGLPRWQGTAIGIDINVDETVEFFRLLDIIRGSYNIDVKARKKDYYKRARFG